MFQHHSTTHSTTSDVGAASRRTGRSLGVFSAGVAATLLGGLALASVPAGAEKPESMNSEFFPVTPCRLFDTRPGSNVGDRDTPLGPGETHVQQVAGEPVGDCNIPPDAVAVSINATAVDASAPSFATFFPNGVDRPQSSNLNYVPGQAPTPNKIDVQLGSDGALGIFNAFGEVDMVGDVTGYYLPSTEARLAGRIEINKLSQPFTTYVETTSSETLGDSLEPVASIEATMPVNGSLLVTYDTTAMANTAGDEVMCGLLGQIGTKAPTSLISLEAPYIQRWESPGVDGGIATMHGTRVFEAIGDENVKATLYCESQGAGVAFVEDTLLTAQFTPTRD